MDLIVTLQCKDQPGIVHAMTTAVLESRGNIIENQQFTDPTTLDFVMRTRFETQSTIEEVKKILGTGLGKFNTNLNFREVTKKKRALVLVTKESHCLRDLLYLQELGELPIEIPAVISNHSDLKNLTESHNISYIDQSGKSNQETEREIRELIAKENITPPKKPSQDFLGEILGFILCFPNKTPTKYAPISVEKAPNIANIKHNTPKVQEATAEDFKDEDDDGLQF